MNGQGIKRSVFCALFLLIFLSPGYAGEICHYTNGTTGIKGATVPPPGSYYRIYNLFYHSDELKNSSGDSLDVDYSLTVYVNVHRFIWITDKKIFGAEYGMDMVIPFVYKKVEIGASGVDDSSFGLGDIFIEPLILSWRTERADFAVGLGGYVPSGKVDMSKPASPGKDRYTGMATAGSTYYFDTAKTWSLSVLARFEMHTEEDKTSVTPGNDFHFEWGLAKTIGSKWIWDLGVAGYCQWQVTDDKGMDAVAGIHDRVFAAGPQVRLSMPEKKLSFSLVSEWEYGARDRPEGNITTLVVTRRF